PPQHSRQRPGTFRQWTRCHGLSLGRLARAVSRFPFHAARLWGSGFGIRSTEQHFEFASVSRELVEKFSRRTELIEQRARDKYKELEAEPRALMKPTTMACAVPF